MAVQLMTFTGRCIDVLDPDPKLICLEDIAHHLARMCRYGGACPTFYPIADHCVYVADLVAQWDGSRRLERPALAHDWTEAYLQDLISPVKTCVPGYKKLEQVWAKVISDRFHTLDLDNSTVKLMDGVALMAEFRDLGMQDRMIYPPSQRALRFFEDNPPPPVTQFVSFERSEQRLLEAAERLGFN